MGFKPVVKIQNDQQVLVGFVPEEAATVEGAKLLHVVYDDQSAPEPSKEIKDFISKNSDRNFDLHKVVDGEIVCRTVAELQNSTWIDWPYNFSPKEETEK